MALSGYPNNIFLEGGDGVGKNHLALAIIRHLLHHREVIFMNFPQYWLLGYDIRSMNRGKIMEKLNLAPYREAEVRAAMYALDRAIGLGLLLIELERHPNAVIVSDRGPLSNLVTTAYMQSVGKITPLELPGYLINTVGDVDRELWNALQPKSVLCRHLQRENGNAALHRERLDLLEQPEPQRLALELYTRMGIPEVLTADESGWRDVQIVAEEALAKVGITTHGTYQGTLYSALEEQKLILIGPNSLDPLGIGIGPTFIPRADILTWLSLTLKEEIEGAVAVDGATEHKHKLDIAETVLSNMFYIQMERGMLSITLPPLAKDAIRRIFATYPEIPEVILPGTRGGGKDMTLFINKLISSES